MIKIIKSLRMIPKIKDFAPSALYAGPHCDCSVLKLNKLNLILLHRVDVTINQSTYFMQKK